MIDFVQKQLEASDRLVALMVKDFEQRMNDHQFWVAMASGLVTKLRDRDELIESLRTEIEILRGMQQHKEPNE